MKDEGDEPSIWVTVIKLVLIAVLIIGGTGLALWYVDTLQTRAQPGLGSETGRTDWGIARDSPLRR